MYNIRKATMQDVESISRVHVACWAECYPFLPAELHQKRSVAVRQTQWARRIELPQGSVTLVLVVGGQVVGFGHAMPNSDPDLPDVDFELHACYFLPEHRRSAAGPEMMAALLAHAVDHSATSICVWVWRDNPLRVTYGLLGLKAVVRRRRTIEGHSAPEVGYVSRDIPSLVNRLGCMAANVAQRACASGNQQFQPDRLRPLEIRSGTDRR